METTRNIIVRVRCTPDEHRALRAIVEYDRRMSMSEVLRELIRDGAKKRGLWPPSDNGNAIEAAP